MGKFMAKKILLIADARGWIFDRHCNEIKKRLTEYEFDIKFTWHDNPSTYKYDQYDLIYQLDPMAIHNLNPPKNKTIFGLRNEFMYGHDINGIYSFYVNEIERKCCAFHVVNRTQLKDFSQVTRIPLMLVQHGVDTDIFKKTKSHHNGEKLIIGTSGNPGSTGKKGFEFVEKACEKTGCILKTAKQNLQSGHLSKEQMAEFYNETDLYCSMSETEGLNNPIMEAGATGIPVISTNVGAVREMIEDGKNGFIIPRTTEALVEKIEYFMKNREMIQIMGNSFMETIRTNWSWNTKISGFKTFFDTYFRSRP